MAVAGRPDAVGGAGLGIGFARQVDPSFGTIANAKLKPQFGRSQFISVTPQTDW